MKRFLRVTDLTELLGASKDGYEGVYFGSEFCAARLPPADETGRARELCRELNLSFTPVTPITRERDLEDVLQWLARAADGEGEYVANDYGILELAGKEWPGLRPHAGRMLSRQQRGPRMAGLVKGADQRAASALKGSLWDDPGVLDDLLNLGVKAVELDAVPWGIGRPELPPGMELTVHAPYAVVTWSPVCFFGPGFLGKCARECVSSCAVRMENDEDPATLWTKGNAVFIRLSDEDAERTAIEAEPAGLVWSPHIPG